MIPSSGLPVSTKNSGPNTSVEAVANRKNSYHSTTVPAIEAATTRFRPLRTSALSLGSMSTGGVTPSAVLMGVSWDQRM